MMTSQGDACWQVPACDLPRHPDLRRLYKHKLEMKRNETWLYGIQFGYILPSHTKIREKFVCLFVHIFLQD